MCGRVRLASDYSEIKISWLNIWKVSNDVGNVRNKGPQLFMPV